MPAPTNPYDSVLYPSLAFPQTHPDRLAVMATLLGMSPPDVEECRVLELACGSGGNLIPMAYGLPNSEFVGVDLAAKPVEIAQERINQAGLKNIRVEKRDLLEVGADFGQFDYIIAHGAYAWVPEQVQAKILEICQTSLTANGVAFVSYNTNPAGHVRQILREMILFHESRYTSEGGRVSQGTRTVEKILKAAEVNSPWKALLESSLKLDYQRDEKVVHHDDLGECFSPVSFAAFLKRASVVGLQFLSEATLDDLLDPELGADALAALSDLADGDAIARRQYLDFAQCRRFRQTLLCHVAIFLHREGIAERLTRLLVASPLRVSSEAPDGTIEFSKSQGTGSIKTNNPVLVAVLKHLEKLWPRAEKFDDLLNAGLRLVRDEQRAEILRELGEVFLKLAAKGLADLRTHHLPLARGVSEKPTASRLARLMARDSNVVTTLLHTHLRFEDDAGKQLLELLDGTRDRQALASAMGGSWPSNLPVENLNRVDEALNNLYRAGLLTR